MKKSGKLNVVLSVYKPEELTEDIVSELDRLDELCFPEDDLYDKKNGENPYCPGEHIWWTVSFKPHKVIVAFAGLKIYAGGQKAFMCRSGVLPNCRGIGIHQDLVKARVDYADRIGIKILETYTSRDNYASVNNLIRSGFLLCEPCFDIKTPASFLFLRRKSK
jgi:GNAT superfamily N-acetyltransferase